MNQITTKTENENLSKVCVIGTTVVKNLFGNENPVGKYIKINRKQFRVIGILPVKGAQGYRDADDVVIVPLNTAMKRLLGTKYISSVAVEVQDGKLNVFFNIFNNGFVTFNMKIHK